MQKAIDHKLNPPIANQRLTRRRANIASSMRADGVVLMKIQTALYALTWAWQNETISTYFERSKAIGNLRLKDDIKSLIWRWNAVNVPANLQKIGVTTITEWEKAQAVLNELVEDFRSSAAPAGSNRALAQKMAQLHSEVKELERELIGAKIPGFFPTPLPLIKEMLRLANIKEGDVVLEPSAGKGDICDAVLDYAEENDLKNKIEIIAVEQNYSLIKVIEKRKEIAVTDGLRSDAFYIEQADFLNLNVPDLSLVDKVVMNPPFEGGIEINHIVHAASFLKPNGKLVAIMSEGSLNRSFQKEMLFKRWIFSLFENGEAFVSASIKDAFNTNTSFRQTGVAVRIITITCPADGVVKVPEELEALLSGKRVAAPKAAKSTATNNDIDEDELLELEAIAQIEILKLANANAKAKGLQGIGSNYRAGNTRKSKSTFNMVQLIKFQVQLLSL
jgi:phospholipid N-methyltransferase